MDRPAVRITPEVCGHIVNGVDEKVRVIFLRALRNYGENAIFLEYENEIKKMLYHV